MTEITTLGTPQGVRVVCPPCPHVHSVEEAAALLNAKPRTLRDKAAARQIPSVRVGKTICFTDEHIARIIADASREAEPVPVRRDARRRS